MSKTLEERVEALERVFSGESMTAEMVAAGLPVEVSEVLTAYEGALRAIIEINAQLQVRVERLEQKLRTYR